MPPMPLMDGMALLAGLCTLWTPKGDPRMSTPAEKPKPFLLPEYCKGCGRCIEACARHCIELGTEINPADGAHPGASWISRTARPAACA